MPVRAARYVSALMAVTPVMRTGAASARLQALGLVHRRGLGIREKVDQRLYRDWLLGQIRGAGNVDEIRTLQLGRQGPDHVDARHLHQLGNRLYTELRLATGHRFSNQRALRGTCRNQPRLRFELGGDAELLEHLRQVLPTGGAARRIGIRDRFGVEQRFFQRFDRADVGLCGTLLHRQTDLGARQRLRAAADDLGLTNQLVDARLGKDRDIDFIACGNLFLDVAGGRVFDL